MRNLIIGLVIGLILGGSFAWAAARYVLVNGGGTEIGTAASPLYVQFQ